MSIYIKHSEDDSLTHYGVKGMKWKHHKYRDKLLGLAERYAENKSQEMYTKAAAAASPSRIERSVARVALKTRQEAKRRKTLRYRAGNAFRKVSGATVKSSKKLSSKGKSIIDRVRNRKTKKSNTVAKKAISNVQKNAKIRSTVKKAANNSVNRRSKTGLTTYKVRETKQTGVRGTPIRNKKTIVGSTTHYGGYDSIGEMRRYLQADKKRKVKRGSTYSRR